jgi:hypothetical protein
MPFVAKVTASPAERELARHLRIEERELEAGELH